MKLFDYCEISIDSALGALRSDAAKGLAGDEVAKRLRECGPNRLELDENGPWRIFLRQFKSSFVYLMLAALLITLLLGEYVDALMIFLFVGINTVLGFLQEYRSEKTLQLLRNYARPRARVLRDDKNEVIAAEGLVPGDIIILETGDKVPADARIIEQDDLIVDETILTGESVPVYKDALPVDHSVSSYYEAANLLFAGTDIRKGRAKALVIATGKDSAFGQVAKLVGETRKESDFEKGIASFSRFILKLVGMTLALVLAAHLILSQGAGFFELIIFSVALTISVIPEALPLVTTFSLARGARRLVSRHVIVKRLSAIEDLGGIEVLLSDKTGTLTENRLELSSTRTDDKSKLLLFANLAGVYDDAARTEPFDIALWQNMDDAGKRVVRQAERLAEQPFDPSCRYNAVATRHAGKEISILRGAPESIISLCDQTDAGEALAWCKAEGQDGRRSIAVAWREGADIDNIGTSSWQLAGLLSFTDPVKPSTKQAVEEARKLGVRLVIITGDSREVAASVAREINLTEKEEEVFSGADWEKAGPEERSRLLSDARVFARVSPEQKFSIISAMRERYMTGFLGEGINDAPALKVAGVSLVVDSAADIAREAADIILTEKDLTVIIDGIREGRLVFSNTTKYIKSTLASNFGNFFAVASASLLIDFLPMLPVQILLVNLLSDTPMISISTDNVEASELKSPRKYEARDIIIIAMVLGFVSTVFDFLVFALFYKISPAVLQTNWFIASILTELALLFSIRSRVPFYRAVRPSAPIIWLSIITVLTTIALPYTYFGQNVLRFVAPEKEHLIIIFSLVGIYFVFTELVKRAYYNWKSNV